MSHRRPSSASAQTLYVPSGSMSGNAVGSESGLRESMTNPDVHAGSTAPRKKKFACPQCDRVFAISGHLTRHLRMHTGERNFKCPFPSCNTSTSRHDNLLQHYRIHLSPGSKRTPAAVRAALEEARQAAQLAEGGASDYDDEEDSPVIITSSTHARGTTIPSQQLPPLAPVGYAPRQRVPNPYQYGTGGPSYASGYGQSYGTSFPGQPQPVSTQHARYLDGQSNYPRSVDPSRRDAGLTVHSEPVLLPEIKLQPQDETEGEYAAEDPLEERMRVTYGHQLQDPPTRPFPRHYVPMAAIGGFEGYIHGYEGNGSEGGSMRVSSSTAYMSRSLRTQGYGEPGAPHAVSQGDGGLGAVHYATVPAAGEYLQGVSQNMSSASSDAPRQRHSHQYPSQGGNWSSWYAQPQ